MKGDPFAKLVAFQEEVIAFQRRQLDLASQSLKAAEDTVALQKAGRRAVESGARAWLQWIELWTPKR